MPPVIHKAHPSILTLRDYLLSTTGLFTSCYPKGLGQTVEKLLRKREWDLGRLLRCPEGEAVHTEHGDPVNEFLPEGKPQGHVLVVSDYRSLNIAHAAALCKAGYAVYTAVTCTDVPRVYESFDVGQIDLIVFASLVHGWHHEEAEERPRGLPMESDTEWQTRNILQVVDLVSRRQQTPPRVLIATDLVDYDCYSVSKCALEQAGLKIQTYSAGNPPSILRLLQT